MRDKKSNNLHLKGKMHTLMFEKITGKCIFYCSSVEKSLFYELNNIYSCWSTILSLGHQLKGNGCLISTLILSLDFSPIVQWFIICKPQKNHVKTTLHSCH